MANFLTAKWIEDLALQECSIRSGERTTLDLLETREQVLQLETVRYMRDLFSHFESLTRIFNSHLSTESAQIRLLKQSEAREAFSLERQGMFLAINASGSGTVQVQCCRRMEGASSEPSRHSVMFSGLIEAKFGSFHRLDWEFLGAAVSAEQVAQHYITEFIQISR